MTCAKSIIGIIIRFAVKTSCIIICIPLAVLSGNAWATGGVFPNTEHGGTDATYPDRATYPSGDGVTGVNRGRIAPYYSGFYEDSSNIEAGRYQSGECNHCHEPHASFGGGEPVPNWGSHGATGGGPDKYLLFADYDDKWTRTDLCGFCHQETDADANGIPNDTPYDYSFKGVTRFQGTAHFAPPGGRNPVQWPGGQYGSTYPAKSSWEAGTCVNCHSPHGYPYSSSEVAATSGTPYPKQLVELADISNKNPSTSPITTWPNVSGRDPVDAEDLCYTCHDGSPVTNNELAMYNTAGSGYASGTTNIKDAFAQTYHHPVNDSEQTGKTSYYQADVAKQINVHYAVECTTCHNPHLASGRWDDATSGSGSPTPIVLPGVTQGLYRDNPATYPYQWPPSSWGLSYQPGDLWGDDPEEKINSLLQRFPNKGTGGWQFNLDRGYAYSATNMPFDQPPKYQPPSGGTTSGQYEPNGDSLPDYITFCLDCHQHQVGTHLPIYWGAEFPPGVNKTYCASGTTPAGDCVTASGWEPHGFDAANVGAFACCNPPGNNCGDPLDNPSSPLYGEPIGLGFSVWTKSPYEMVDRIAGINFVLACTNCHEPHGSPRSSLFRKVVNGSNLTNNDHRYICNACHYYYGGDMTYEGCGGGGLKGCGVSSCHLKQSLHRIDKNDLGTSVVLYAPISHINLGPQVPAMPAGMIGTSQNDRATNPEVIGLADGRYRIYYAYRSTASANFWDIYYKDTGDTNPPNDTNVTASPPQALGIGVSGDHAYAPEILQLADGRYRLYYTRTSGGSTIVYRDTVDTNPPNASNLGAATTLIGAETLYPNVVARPGGGYRIYYALGTFEQIVYKDTTDANPPNNTNLGSAVTLGIGGSEFNRTSWPKVMQTPTGYRLYYGYGDTVPSCVCWRIMYRDTTDANLPGPSNLSLMKTLNTGGTSTNSAYDTEIIQLPSGFYRMYYVYIEITGNYAGNYQRIVYKDTIDANLPNVGY